MGLVGGRHRKFGGEAAMIDAAPSMDGKTVLITGGTGGIGRAAAIGLASMGARVGIIGRDRDRSEVAGAAIARESGNAQSCPAMRWGRRGRRTKVEARP